MKKIFFISIVIIVSVCSWVFADGNSEGSGEHSNNVLESHLVDADWLASNLDMGNLVILDTARKPEEFTSGHVSGALYADRQQYWAVVDGIPGMFPGIDPVKAWFEELGISNDSAVVIYDAGAGLWAARVAWTLAYLGHDNWAVLDGGYALWEADGHLTESGETQSPELGNFIPEVKPELLVSGDDIAEHLDDPNFVVLDARSPEEYNGTNVIGARGGHIPGALSVEWTLNNTASSLPTFLPPDQLGEFYVSEGVDTDKDVVTLCQTGVRGAHSWLALTLAGYKNVALYDGSWADWASNEAYPVEQ